MQNTVKVYLCFLGNQLYKFILMVSGKGRHVTNAVKEQFLNDHIAYLVRTTAAFDFAVGSTHEMLFVMLPTAMTDLI